MMNVRRALPYMSVTCLMLVSFQNCSQQYGLNGIQSPSNATKGAQVMIEDQGTELASQIIDSGQSEPIEEPGSVMPIIDVGVDQNDSPVPSQGPIKLSDHELKEICDRINSKHDLLEVADESSIRIKGSLNIRAHRLKLITGNGSVRVVGLNEESLIEEIKDSNGNHVLCGINVLKLSNVGGNVVLVGGQVADTGGTKNVRIVPAK